MSDSIFPSVAEWGHQSPPIGPDEMVENLVREATWAIDDYAVLPEGPESCDTKSGYARVFVAVPLCATLFDQLMNGPTGYRAHYSISVTAGEAFNRRLIDALAPLVVRAEHLYKDKFDRPFCEKSLSGAYSKLWFPKSITDPSARSLLEGLREELHVPRWRAYWSSRPKPWKGLLAPLPEDPGILLNGTFVNDAGGEYEQKPQRSVELFESGWA